MRILAVDDESYILELMPLLAARTGFPDVTTAASGRAALDLLDHDVSGFDCLLLDINMPGMDGIDLCSCVRQIDGYRMTPIIMLTAMSDRDSMDRAFKAGATDYATKPFDIHELGARLRAAQDLIIARRVTQPGIERRSAAGTLIGPQHDFELSEPIRIEGAADLIDFASLKNYLKQSSRAGLAASQLIAVRVDQIEDIYARASTAEFHYALSEVADAIHEVMRPLGGLVSYAGFGTIMVVSNTATQLSVIEIEGEVQHLLDQKNSEYDCGVPLDIDVSIGNPVQPAFTDIAGASRCLERAAARAESRSKAKLDGSTTPAFRRF